MQPVGHWAIGSGWCAEPSQSVGEESWMDVQDTNLCDDTFSGIARLTFQNVHCIVRLLREFLEAFLCCIFEQNVDWNSQFTRQSFCACLFSTLPLLSEFLERNWFLGWKMEWWGKINGSCLHLSKYSVKYLSIFPKYSGFGCACVFTWSQTGGASAKCPPLINHVLAIAAFSLSGSKTPSSGDCLGCWPSLRSPQKQPGYSKNVVVSEWGEKGTAAFTLFFLCVSLGNNWSFLSFIRI